MPGGVFLTDSNSVEKATNGNPLVVTGATGGGAVPIAVGGSGYTTTVSLTRTSDTNAYAAGDVIGAATGATAALTFAAIGVASNNIMLTGASLEIDVSAIPSGMGAFSLALYSVTPPSALGDNAAWDLPAGDRTSYLGTISLGAPLDLGSTLYSDQTQINKQIKLPASATLFAYLVTNAGWTPAASTVFVINLHAVGL